MNLRTCQVWEAGVKVHLLLSYRKHLQQIPNAASVNPCCKNHFDCYYHCLSPETLLYFENLCFSNSPTMQTYTCNKRNICLLTTFGKLIRHIASSWPSMKIFSPDDPYLSCRLSCLTMFQFISNKVVCMIVETYL